VLVWLSVWSEVHTCIWPSWCHCHSLPLASVKSRWVLPFWYQLTQVVPEKGPLNGCVWSLITQQLTSTSGWTVKRLARSISASRSWRRRSSASSFSRASSCWRRMRSSAPRLFSSAMHGDDCQSLIRTGNISKIRLHHTTNVSNAVTCTKWVTKNTIKHYILHILLNLSRGCTSTQPLQAIHQNSLPMHATSLLRQQLNPAILWWYNGQK